MDFPCGETVTIVSTTTTTDSHGDSTTETVTYEWGPCGIAPRYSNESTDPRVAPLVVGKAVYGPAIDVADLAIDADDTLVIAGSEWQVVGEPEDYTGAGRNPFTGWEPGLVVNVVRAGSA